MVKKNSEIENEVYRFIKILVVVIALILGVYFFTNAFVNSDYDIKKNGQAGEISNNNIIVGSILNRPYDEYYVIAYKSSFNDSTIYETYMKLYESSKDSLRIYVVDLDNELNKEYYEEIGNKKAQSIEDLKLSSPTLLKIKDKKINKYIEGQEAIKKEFGL